MSLLFTRSIAVVAALLLSFTTANPASAALRNPQVAIQGSGLQDLLNAQGELIDVRTAQQDAGLLRFSTFNPSVSSFSNWWRRAAPPRASTRDTRRPRP